MILIPKNCPVCESALERVKDQLFCRNSNCSAQSSKQILHFSKTMKIMGLGEKTLEKLELESINDIYNYTVEELKSILGEKIGTKLFNEIANSRIISLSTFINAFGIPLIGSSASAKLATVCKSLWDIDAKACKQAGIGDKATNNLLQWIIENREQYSDLPITTTVSEVTEPEDILYNVAITGKLEDYSSRAKAKQVLESKGIKVLSKLSSNASYLICDQEDSRSSSYKKAVQLNIPVITMKNLLNII